jgi:DNA repair protein RadA/Sms
MAKSHSTWRCTDCGANHAGWFGRCPACGAWNTVEEQAPAGPADRVVLGKETVAVAVPIPDVRDSDERTPVGIGEVDRVLGGGLVHGSVVLVGGPPGIGKSTLLLQVSAALAAKGKAVVYASGEESITQLASRAGRLGAAHPRLLVMAETRSEAVLDAARELAIAQDLTALVVDSIQTVYSSEHDGLPGNVSQVRAVCAQLISFAKQHDVPVIIVGHVTKDGQLAGPRVLEHMVDAVLSFEGDEDRATRLLRSTKNRFGSTLELGVFDMGPDGLRPIDNPSEAFLSQRAEAAPGSCVTVSLQGSRPLLLEVQALLSPSHGGSPRRNCVGVDTSRLAMLLAVLDRHGATFVLDHDVFLNVAGGVRLFEPASDLAVLLAVASSHLRRPVPPGMVALGEIGLTGELRHVARLDTRLAEAARLGFTKALVAPPPPSTRGRKLEIPKGIDVRTANTVARALELAF